MGGDPVNYTLSTPGIQCSGVAWSPYSITVTPGNNPNYIVTVSHGMLTVIARQVKVGVDNESKIYGDPDPAFTVTVTGQAPGCDPVNYTLATTAIQCRSVAGSPYPILVTLGANPNYSVTVNQGTLTVTARPITVTVASKSKTYGDPNPALEATVTGLAPGDDAMNYILGEAAGCDPVNYTLGTTATQCSNLAGSPYPITAALGANPNYNITVI